MNDLEFRPVDFKNLDEIIDLQVKSEQTKLVADNLYSIAQAGLDPVGDSRAVYLEDRPVGFFYISTLHEARLLYICRFMVDAREQGHGLGRRIMKKFLDEAFASPELEMVDLAVSQDTGNAEGFYKKCGFVSTGERYQGGWRMTLSRTSFHTLSQSS